MDRLTSLNVFGHVVENGGFSAAGRKLNMSVTMVSNHIQSLEDRLGARLLNRTTRKVSLTEIGKAYYERSKQILNDLEEADRLADSLNSTPRGTLRVFTNSNIVRYLSPVVSEFLAANPNVTLDVVTGERMPDLIEEGFDLAIHSIIGESSLIVRRLSPFRHVLCCAPNYLETHGAPRQPSDLTRHNCLRYTYYPFSDGWRFEGPDGKIIAVPVTGNFVTANGEMLRQLALDGRGVYFAPTFVMQNDLSEGRLVRVAPDYRGVEFAIHAIYPHRHHLSSKVRVFIDLLADRFAQHRTWMDPVIR
jgi:DNA-binding transcriptional LysR family regulator